ncbi:MAG: DUF4436 family protein [Acidimicrobiales bacterium]
MKRRRPSTRSQRVLLWTLVGVVALAGLTVLRVPRGEPVPRQVEQSPSDDAAVIVGITVDSVDAPRSTMKVRLHAVPGPKAPPEGVTVFTNIPGAPQVKVVTDRLSGETTSEVEFTSGDVADYPFDRYHADVLLVAVRGADTKLEDAEKTGIVPVAVQGYVTATGFDVRADGDGTEAVAITFDLNRTGGSRGWVVAMMVIYWSLAAAAFAVVVVTLLGERSWETRHLAWLGSMIFAVVAFRNAAPGTPPIGTFFDWMSFFPALAVVALSLLLLVGYYLVSPRDRLGL